jgi:hypothetical protein
MTFLVSVISVKTGQQILHTNTEASLINLVYAHTSAILVVLNRYATK